MYFQRARQKPSTFSNAEFKCTFYLCDGFPYGLPTESTEAFCLHGANRSVIAVNAKNSQKISGESPFYYTISLLQLQRNLHCSKFF